MTGKSKDKRKTGSTESRKNSGLSSRSGKKDEVGKLSVVDFM